MDLLFVGLGNPGKEYENTRHNAGFMMIDSIAKEFGSISYNKKFSSECQKITIFNKNIFLLKPQTYINLSGKAVQSASSFYKLNPSQIWVFHDDAALETARLKIKIGGGSGGHNGIKSIDEYIGKNYYRVRMGINHPPIYNLSDFVLENFSKIEMDKIYKIMDTVVVNIELLLQQKIDKFLSKITL